MKNRLLLLSFLICLCVACQKDNLSDRETQADTETGIDYSKLLKGWVKVKFKELPGDIESLSRGGELVTGMDDLDEVARSLGATRIEKIFPLNKKFEKRYRKAGLHLWYNLYFDENVKLSRAMRDLGQLDRIAAVCPVKKINHYSTFSVPDLNIKPFDAANGEYPYNDEFLQFQWNFYNPGSDDGEYRAGADINLFEAWKIEKGKPNVIVAVTGNDGFDRYHEDLRDNIWFNEAELNGEPDVDDDGNGFVDDVSGLYKEGKLDEHETFIAGIIAAKNNNGIGVASIAGGDDDDSGVKLMSLSVSNYKEAAYQYAADMGAVISQNSWGDDDDDTPGLDDPMVDAIKYFIENAGMDDEGNQIGPMRGGIVVFAGGNENTSDTRHMWPANTLDEIIVVGAFGPSMQKASYSNYGDLIDVCAPGGDDYGRELCSTAPDNGYTRKYGTSHAAPHVSGVLALMVSKFQREGLTAEEITKRFFRACKTDLYDYNPGFIGKLGKGRIDAALALSDEPLNDPPVITLDGEMERTDVIYGQKADIIFQISDLEGDEMTYEITDSLGCISHVRSGNTITVTIFNQDVTSGIYTETLTVTDAHGHATSRDFTFLMEEKQPDEVIFWPTPVKNRLFMLMARDMEEEVTVKFRNTAGVLVYTEKVNVRPLHSTEIRPYKLSGGIYTVTVETSKGKYTRNIIKI